MKKIIKIAALVFAFVLCLSMWACGDIEETEAETTMPLLEGEEGDTYTQFDYNTADLSKYVTVGQYKGLAVSAPRPVVSESEVGNYLQELIDANTTYEPYEEKVTDRATVAGDFVNISYVGTIDGELFEGGSAEGDSVVLAENNGYIDWFEDDLYGIMPGETVVSTGRFPDEYYEELAGKEVTFAITLNYIAGHYTIPELTDEFVQEKFGLENEAALKDALKADLQAESDANYEVDKLSLMWSQIMETVQVAELPTEQIMYYYTAERSFYEMYAAQNGITYEQLLQYMGATDEELYEYMANRVKQEIVVHSIAKAEGIELTDEDYSKGLAEYAASRGVSQAELVENYGEDYIRESLLLDKVIYALGVMNSFIE